LRLSFRIDSKIIIRSTVPIGPVIHSGENGKLGKCCLATQTASGSFEKSVQADAAHCGMNIKRNEAAAAMAANHGCLLLHLLRRSRMISFRPHLLYPARRCVEKSDDVIERVLTSRAAVCRVLFALLQRRRSNFEANLRDAVSFSSARTTKRLPCRRDASSGPVPNTSALCRLLRSRYSPGFPRVRIGPIYGLSFINGERARRFSSFFMLHG
jgi:hypothetical protein